MVSGPRGTPPRALAPTTRQRRLVSLRGLLRFAAREQWLPGDLGATIDLPKLPERPPKPLDDADRLTLTGALGGDTLMERRDRALILFLLSTGCRIAEALALDREDWGHDRVVVRGKGDRERSVLVTDSARAAVDAYLTARHDSSSALFVGLQPASMASAENRLTPQGARFICRRLAAELGVPAFHTHRLRHTLGTLLQEQLGDARLTAGTLGHAGLASVAGYTRISEARRRQALVLELLALPPLPRMPRVGPPAPSGCRSPRGEQGPIGDLLVRPRLSVRRAAATKVIPLTPRGHRPARAALARRLSGTRR
jgi:integrase/recombinase XerD